MKKEFKKFMIKNKYNIIDLTCFIALCIILLKFIAPMTSMLNIFVFLLEEVIKSGMDDSFKLLFLGFATWITIQIISLFIILLDKISDFLKGIEKK